MASQRGERKSILLRLDPLVHDALNRWANDDLRSTNAQIEFLLRRTLTQAGRMPSGAGEMRGPGRPAGSNNEEQDDAPKDGRTDHDGSPGSQ